MKTLKTLVAATLLAAAAFGITACDDSKHIAPEAVNEASLKTDEPAKLYKMEYDEKAECKKFTEVKTVTVEEAQVANLQSAFALCEERYKPVNNSKVTGNVENEDGETEYNTPDARFVCFHSSQVEKLKKEAGECEG